MESNIRACLHGGGGNPLRRGNPPGHIISHFNLITLKLTSGYRSGQDVKKPENMGKCSHDGTLDESRLKPATGGINKDTATTVESPHAR